MINSILIKSERNWSNSKSIGIIPKWIKIDHIDDLDLVERLFVVFLVVHRFGCTFPGQTGLAELSLTIQVWLYCPWSVIAWLSSKFYSAWKDHRLEQVGKHWRYGTMLWLWWTDMWCKCERKWGSDMKIPPHLKKCSS